MRYLNHSIADVSDVGCLQRLISEEQKERERGIICGLYVTGLQQNQIKSIRNHVIWKIYRIITVNCTDLLSIIKEAKHQPIHEYQGVWCGINVSKEITDLLSNQ